jgi:hypothetical protein
MKSIVYYTYPPASLSVDHELGNLLVQQATLVIGRWHMHSKDRVVGRCILAQAVLGVCAWVSRPQPVPVPAVGVRIPIDCNSFRNL